MLRMFSRAHCSQTHLVRPRSTPADHPRGGGSEGERVPHRWHTTSGTAASLDLADSVRPGKQPDPPDWFGRVWLWGWWRSDGHQPGGTAGPGQRQVGATLEATRPALGEQRLHEAVLLRGSLVLALSREGQLVLAVHGGAPVGEVFTGAVVTGGRPGQATSSSSPSR